MVYVDFLQNCFKEKTLKVFRRENASVSGCETSIQIILLPDTFFLVLTNYIKEPENHKNRIAYGVVQI